MPCASLYISTSHTHTGQNDFFTHTAALLLSKLCEVTDSDLLTQADVVHSRQSCMFEEWMKGSEQVQCQRNKDDLMLIQPSHQISAPHIFPGHGGFQGAEQGWVYMRDSSKDTGLETRKVSKSSASQVMPGS